jgi:hypothetical protein
MKLLIGIVLMSALMQATCNKKNDREVRMGQSVPADIVVIFKPGTTLEQRQEFDETTIGVPYMDGFGLKDGIEAELAVASICPKQDGVALKLREDITVEQLREIRTAIDHSPIVEKVLENSRPSEVRC